MKPSMFFFRAQDDGTLLPFAPTDAELWAAKNVLLFDPCRPGWCLALKSPFPVTDENRSNVMKSADIVAVLAWNQRETSRDSLAVGDQDGACIDSAA